MTRTSLVTRRTLKVFGSKDIDSLMAVVYWAGMTSKPMKPSTAVLSAPDHTTIKSNCNRHQKQTSAAREARGARKIGNRSKKTKTQRAKQKTRGSKLQLHASFHLVPVVFPVVPRPKCDKLEAHLEKKKRREPVVDQVQLLLPPRLLQRFDLLRTNLTPKATAGNAV